MGLKINFQKTMGERTIPHTSADEGVENIWPFLCAKSKFQWESNNNIASSKAKIFV